MFVPKSPYLDVYVRRNILAFCAKLRFKCGNDFRNIFHVYSNYYFSSRCQTQTESHERNCQLLGISSKIRL